MQSQEVETGTRTRLGWAALIAAGLVAGFVTNPGDAMAGPKVSKVWKTAAKNLKKAVTFEVKADYYASLATASILDDEDDRDDAEDEAKEEYGDLKSLAKEQYKARLDLAADLEEDEIYAVDINPANFTSVINNPFMPLTPGVTRTYEGETEDGTETVIVEVLGDTVEILGVTCVVVRDRAYLDDVLIEDTHDWYAQDMQGNVWYFGELALNYEDGRLVDVEGSWEAGVDGAQPGIVMQAVPMEGDLYRQEFLLGEAEDYAEVLSLTETVVVPFATYNNCLMTFDGSPIEPDVEEHKYYASGVGVVLEVDEESGERLELIDIND